MSAARAPDRLRAPRATVVKRGWRVALGALSHREGHRSEWLAALWLMSGEASYVTGTILDVAGGR